ncbi:hypothetical protein [Nitrospira sp. BLG_2]|uniref:hypothetical protein n=1 Tax=Nitrospira sp. BLG_2 TaxID=3397507 RepID=UPI003B991401
MRVTKYKSRRSSLAEFRAFPHPDFYQDAAEDKIAISAIIKSNLAEINDFNEHAAIDLL